MDGSDGLMRLVGGGIFIAFGIMTIMRREMEIGIGGRFGTSSLFTVNVTGRGAIFLGITQILGGAIFGASFIFYWLGELLSSDLLFSLPSVGIVISFLGIIISPLLSSNPEELHFRNGKSHPLIQINESEDEAMVMIDKAPTNDSDNEMQ